MEKKLYCSPNQAKRFIEVLGVDPERIHVVELLPLSGEEQAAELWKEIEVNEDTILDAFRWMKQGGKPNLGVKSPWWAKLIESAVEREEYVPAWTPNSVEIQFYEELLLKCFLRLNKSDKEILVLRCGTGRKQSFRKCGKARGTSHEIFRQQLQGVISKLKKVFDESSKNRL